ncbi:MAG TPA: hypothetical protein PL085_11765 [Agriterribacter sp.]|uniref:hypothetical protein n=1 Tax=Agriterribacter sp. TaxID=2821509 RepID=UPI002C7DB7B9|nr:hypothetical protein [Agriterribacter sp.]HRQ17746.1 hypothetical protein [Agriterribacter sp.]
MDEITTSSPTIANTMLAVGAGNSVKGKYFEMLSIDDSIMHRFKINHVREDTTPAVEHEDGSRSPSRVHLLVSAEGSGWFRVYGGMSDRIVEQ